MVAGQAKLGRSPWCSYWHQQAHCNHLVTMGVINNYCSEKRWEFRIANFQWTLAYHFETWIIVCGSDDYKHDGVWYWGNDASSEVDPLIFNLGSFERSVLLINHSLVVSLLHSLKQKWWRAFQCPNTKYSVFQSALYWKYQSSRVLMDKRTMLIT